MSTLMNISSAVKQLERNGSAIVALASAVDAEQARWRPAPDKWSILEVVCHLADEEREDFRTRLDLILHNPTQEWPPIDPEGVAISREYNSGELSAAIADFAREREKSIEWLASLGEPDLAIEHVHVRFGSMSAGSMLASWLAHDLLHIRQLAKLHYQYLVDQASPYAVDYAGPLL